MSDARRALRSTTSAAALAVLLSLAQSAGGCSSTPEEQALSPENPDAAPLPVGDGGADAPTDGPATSDAPPLDPTADNDGDGFLFADDCDDREPRVNPGAFEVPGDKRDNDCDGKVDVLDSCDEATGPGAIVTSDPIAFAKALGVCRQTTAGATGKSLRWGLVSARLVRINDAPITGASVVQYGVLPRFGANITPREGKNVVALSTGTARTPDLPGYQNPRTSSYRSASTVGWSKRLPLMAERCTPCDDGCPPTEGRLGIDSVVLELVVRVPTNARAFRYAFDFLTSERFGVGCHDFPDTFATFLTSKAGHLGPAFDDNVALVPIARPFFEEGYWAGNLSTRSPIDSALSRFFDHCTSCAEGGARLAGTGFDDGMGAATGWLENVSPVAPGELATIRFTILDGPFSGGDPAFGGGGLDSTVLLDQFRWDEEAAGPTVARPKL